MYRKVGIIVASALLLASPLLASAETAAELQAQIQKTRARIDALKAQLTQTTAAPVTPQTSNACPRLTRTLSLGMYGSDVGGLQKFLGVALNNTFDEKTENAVRSWQASYGIVSSGSAATTGWGAVGPRTRALIALNCAIGGSSANQCKAAPASPLPELCAKGSWQKVYNTNSCHIDWKCSGTVVALPRCELHVPLESISCAGVLEPVQNELGCVTKWICRANVQCPQYPVPTCTASQKLEYGSIVNGCTGAPRCVDPGGAFFSATPTFGRSPLTVRFETQAVSGLSIGFGDGKVEGVSSSAVNHTYQEPGTYTAHLLKGTNCTLSFEGYRCNGARPDVLDTVRIDVRL